MGASLTTFHSSSPRANVAHLAVHLVPSWPLLCHVSRRCLSVLWSFALLPKRSPSFTGCPPSPSSISLPISLGFLNPFMIAQRQVMHFSEIWRISTIVRESLVQFLHERVYSPFWEAQCFVSRILCIYAYVADFISGTRSE